MTKAAEKLNLKFGALSNLRLCSHLKSAECVLFRYVHFYKHLYVAFRNDSSSVLMTVFNGNSHSTEKLIQLPAHSSAVVYDENNEMANFAVS